MAGRRAGIRCISRLTRAHLAHQNDRHRPRSRKGPRCALPERTSCTVATTTMRSRGIRAITIGEITGRLGLSRSSFYLRFDSRTHLIEEVLLAYFDRLRSGAAASVLGVPVGLARLVQILEFWIRSHVAQRGGCLILSAPLNVRHIATSRSVRSYTALQQPGGTIWLSNSGMR